MSAPTEVTGTTERSKIRLVRPDDGWRGIERALLASSSGDTVRLFSGKYNGSSPLRLPSGVELVGDEGTEMHYQGDNESLTVIKVDGVQSAVIRNLLIVLSISENEFVFTSKAKKILAASGVESSVSTHESIFDTATISGLIDVSDATDIVVDTVVCKKPSESIYSHIVGIATRASHNLTIKGCSISGCRHGIALLSSSARLIEGNDCFENSMSSIVLQSDSNSPDAHSNAPLMKNRCHQNSGTGIVLMSSSSEIIEDNECFNNGMSGILLQADANSFDVPSSASLVRNRCHNNKGPGIALISSNARRIEECVCTHNNGNGIVLQRDTSRLEVPSHASLIGNYCHHNAQSGIALLSSNADRIENNDCVENGMSGVMLQSDSNVHEEASSALLVRNRCSHNSETGVTLSSSYAECIEGNVCAWNGMSGILLQPGPNSADTPSNAPLVRNQCHHNVHSGIALCSSNSARIEDNDCTENGASGIVLMGNTTSREMSSSAQVLRNRCHHNTGPGIALRSSKSKCIRDNDCAENGISGIVLERDTDFPDTPSSASLFGNRCHHNTGSGIALISSNTENIDNNDCTENGSNGIVLQCASDLPHEPSSATLIRNRCHRNAQSGIALISSNAENIENNECSENRLNGIHLQRESRISDAPSHASLVRNVCYRNADAGINIFASESSVLNNTCWDNRWVAVQDVDAPMVTIVDHCQGKTAAADTLLTAHDLRRWGYPLQVMLEREGCAQASALSAVFSGSPCRDCFGAYWRAQIKDEEPIESDELTDATDSADWGSYRAEATVRNTGHYGQLEVVHEPIRFRSNGDSSGLRSCFYALLASRQDSVAVVGCIAANGDAFDDFCEWALTLNAVRHTDERRLKGFSDRQRNLLDRCGHIGTPLRVEGALRDLREPIQEGHIRMSRLFESEVLLNTNKHKERLVAMLTAPPFYVFTTLCLLYLALSDFYHQISEHEEPLRDVVAFLLSSAYHPGSSLSAINLGALGILIIVAGALLLPDSLKNHRSELRRAADKASVILLFGSLQPVADTIRRKIHQPLAHRAWRRLVRRKLLGSAGRNGVTIVGFTNMERWFAGSDGVPSDSDALREVITELKPPQQKMFIIVHVASPALLPDGFIAPFFHQFEGQWCRYEAVDRTLLLHDCHGDQDGPHWKAQHRISLSTLLGLPLASAGEQERTRKIQNTLADTSPSLLDLLPLLALMASPARSLRIRCRDTTDIVHEFRKTTEEMRTFLGLDNEDATSNAGVNMLFAIARDARIVNRLQTTPAKGVPDIMIIGRLGYRHRLKGALQAYFEMHYPGDSEPFDRYLATLAGAAEYTRLRRAWQIIGTLEAEDDLTNAWIAAIQHLEALAVSASYDASLLDERQRSLLETSWRSLHRRLQTPRISDSAPPPRLSTRLYIAFVNGIAQHDQLALQIGATLQACNEWIRGVATGTATIGSSVRDVFVQSTAQVAHLCASLDVDYAEQVMTRAFANDWSSTPPAVQTAFRDLVKALRGDAPATLEAKLIAADDGDAIIEIIRFHRGQPKRLAYVFSVLAAAYCRNRYDSDEAYQSLAIVAQLIEGLRDRTVGSDEQSAAPQKHVMLSFEPSTDYAVMTVLLNPDAHELVYREVENYRPPMRIELPGVHFYAETPVDASVSAGRRVDFQVERALGFYV